MRRCILGVVVGCGLALLVPKETIAQSPRTTRVSVATGGAQATGGRAGSGGPALSADGRYAAFTSEATNLVDGDLNGVRDVFVHDRQTGTTTRVSVVTGGAEANGVSNDPSISADGRFVAFTSEATNLVAGDTNQAADVFVHDRMTHTTTLVSEGLYGGVGGGCEIVLPDCASASLFPSISPDGRFVSFESYATNLVPGGTYWAEVFLRDVQGGTTSLVSVGLFGDADGASISSSVSANGRFIAFDSNSTNLVPGDTNGHSDVFVRDTLTGTTTRVSVGAGDAQANNASWRPAISATGRFVAFTSRATNLVRGDGNNAEDVFVHDRDTGTTTRVSVSSGAGQANGNSSEPSVSADGRHVAFTSQASNLVGGDTNGADDVFVHDRHTGTTRQISITGDGSQANRRSGAPAFSANGRYVAFASSATNLVPGDTNLAADVFLHDRGSWPCDFDGDRATDVVVFRPSTGVWFQVQSSTHTGRATAWGIDGDVPALGDYDGDGTSDAAVFRPSSGTWYVLQSATGTGRGVQWGVAGDVPVPADYDGDGKTDVAVFRPSNNVWYIVRSTTNTAVGVLWGTWGDVPAPADYDGDGKADPTVFRHSSGKWYQLRSTTGLGYSVRWGQAGDVPLAGDYDGDGRADPTVFRESTGTWYELRSATGVGFGVTWGILNDVPVVGDYDGDGKADPTVFRASSGMWYQLRSGSGAGWGLVWGATGDVPQ